MNDVHENLCAALREIDTTVLETPEVIEAARKACPDATLEQIAAALRQVGQEHYQHAQELRQYTRRRVAGISGVIDGGETA